MDWNPRPRSFRPNIPRLTASLVMGVACFFFAACGGDDTKSSKRDYTLSGTPWIPNVAGVSASNHDSSVVESRQTITASPAGASIVGLAQGFSGNEVTVNFTVPEDLGDYGSFTLLAQPMNFPSSLKGSAFAVLTYLSDGTNDFVNLNHAAGGCFDTGMFACTSGKCNFNTSCSVSWPSAFYDGAHWRQRQVDLSFYSPASTNTFPTCNWAGGSAPPSTNSQCAFNSTFFSSGKLRTGSYTARYAIIADSYSTVPAGKQAAVNVTLVRKKRPTANPGAIDVNIVFVGYNVSQASRNAKGKVNMDSLMASLQDFYSAAPLNIRLGTIRSYEWVEGGEPYANVAEADLGTMVATAGSVLSAESSGKAVNIFLVNTIENSYSLLGISGGIGGPPAHGLPNSGVVVSTFGKLDQYNPSCSVPPCSLAKIEYDFADLEQTIAHEIGHYLGVNHPTEGSGDEHDFVPDTPVCTSTDPAYSRITPASCRVTDTNIFPSTGFRCSQTCTGYSNSAGNYCPAKVECQFNYMMFWSSKYFKEGTGAGDGNLFSTQEASMMNFHPMVQ
jgi:hypothetical protein